MKTNPGRVSLAVAANHIDLSARAFNFLIEAGVIPRQSPNVGYSLDEVRIRYIKNLRIRASGQGDGAANLAKARAALAQEQMEAAALRNAVTRGEYVSVADVVRIHTAELSVIRERFLSLPTPLAETLACGDPEKQTAFATAIEAAVCEILEELSSSTAIAERAAERQKGRRR
jgi:hypothetical protein